jgi:hypothetical protein
MAGFEVITEGDRDVLAEALNTGAARIKPKR